MIMERFVLNVINYVSGFDMTGFRHELQIETEKEEYLNYSSKPIKVVWYSGSDSTLRSMEIHSKIVEAYKQVGRMPLDIELVACKYHMHKQENEAESAYLPGGWYPEWVKANQEAERLMAQKINQIRKEKGFVS
jgi:hypothetical protein